MSYRFQPDRKAKSHQKPKANLRPRSPEPHATSWAGPANIQDGRPWMTESRFHEVVPPRERIPYSLEQVAWRNWPDTRRVFISGTKEGSSQWIPFVVARNDAPRNWKNADCFFRALSMIFYGDTAYWPYIKAEHANFLEEWRCVGSQNPNWEYWSIVDQEYDPKHCITIGQQLVTPDTYTHSSVFEITAHLYRVCIVLFHFEDGFDHTPRPQAHYFGAKNREQIFLAAVPTVPLQDQDHDWNMEPDGVHHLCPMFPDVYCPEDFRWKDLDGVSWFPDESEGRHQLPRGRLSSGHYHAPPLTRRKPLVVCREDLEKATGIDISRSETEHTGPVTRKRARELMDVHLNKKPRTRAPNY